MGKSPNVLKIFSTFFIKSCRNRGERRREGVSFFARLKSHVAVSVGSLMDLASRIVITARKMAAIMSECASVRAKRGKSGMIIALRLFFVASKLSDKVLIAVEFFTVPKNINLIL